MLLPLLSLLPLGAIVLASPLTIVLIVLIVVLLFSGPWMPYANSWGYGPPSVVLLLIVILLIVLLL